MLTPGSPFHPPFDVVAIGSSAGGVEALSRVVADLPAGFPAAVVAVHHLYRHGQSALAAILGRVTPLPVSFARDGETLSPGRITIAPADCHLAVDRGGVVRLTRTPRLNFSRPAVDPLFISVAFQFGVRALGVVLTGANGDGGAGAWAIRYAGGMVLVQDTATAAFPEMPQAALSLGAPNYVLPLELIGPAIGALVCRPGVEAMFRAQAPSRDELHAWRN